MSPLAEGLRVSGIGIALVFLALGLLTVLLMVLGRISNWLLASQARRDTRRAGTARDVAGGPSEREELAGVAAMAVAILTARETGARDESLGRLLHTPRW